MSKEVSLTLPYPPSANRYWRRGGNVTYVSKEAKAYKEEVATLGAIARCRPLDGPVSMEAHVYRPRKSGDLMNREKVLSDALQGVAFIDDSQIHEAHFYLGDDKHNPRVEVTIRQL